MQYSYKCIIKIKDKRFSLSTEIINSIKAIRSLNFTQIFHKKITKLRKKEYFFLTFWRSLEGLLGIFWNFLRIGLQYSFLLSFLSQNTLKDTNIFVIMLLFDLLTYPLSTLPSSISNIFKIHISLSRIYTYLSQKETKSSSKSPFSQKINEENAIEMRNCSFFFENEGKSDFILEIPDLKIRKNSLNLVLGEIGSGKSAFLKALLGEM